MTRPDLEVPVEQATTQQRPPTLLSRLVRGSVPALAICAVTVVLWGLIIDRHDLTRYIIAAIGLFFLCLVCIVAGPATTHRFTGPHFQPCDPASYDPPGQVFAGETVTTDPAGIAYLLQAVAHGRLTQPDTLGKCWIRIPGQSSPGPNPSRRVDATDAVAAARSGDPLIVLVDLGQCEYWRLTPFGTEQLTVPKQ